MHGTLVSLVHKDSIYIARDKVKSGLYVFYYPFRMQCQVISKFIIIIFAGLVRIGFAIRLQGESDRERSVPRDADSGIAANGDSTGRWKVMLKLPSSSFLISCRNGEGTLCWGMDTASSTAWSNRCRLDLLVSMMASSAWSPKREAT